MVDRATGRTGNPKYYAGGDCVNGGREVVDAVADGKRPRWPSRQAGCRISMADLTTNFAGIRCPNPFWLASGPPANCGDQVMRAFDAGWGGAVWKTIGEPIVNVSSRYSSVDWNGQRMMGLQQYRAHHRPAARSQPARDRGGQEALSEARRHRVADGGIEARGLARHRQALRRRGRRRPGAELRLSARHERARHGQRRRPGSRICLR